MTADTFNPDYAAAPGQGSYANVNGLNLYYEVHGPRTDARPLILLHGGLGMVGMFAQILPTLAETRQVIGVEMQAHGHTADIDRPFSFEQFADDIAALIKSLDLGTADILGYSLGGGAAQQTAIRHPEVVHKLVVVSAPAKRNGWLPESLEGMSAMTTEFAAVMVGSPPHVAYASAAPRPEDWPVMVGKTGDLLRQHYDWSSDLAGVKVPTLLVFGDGDAVRLDHVMEMFKLVGGHPVILSADGTMDNPPASRLAILPGTNHYDIISHTDLLLPIITQFLDAPTSASDQA
jgi:pimeloyl-ACP methyl ester carboxylesterase